MTEHSGDDGLSGVIHKIGVTLAGILQTRLEILATELEEARLHLGQVLLLALVALFCLGLGLIWLSVLLVVLFWDSHRFEVLGAMTVIFLGTGGYAVFLLRTRIAQRTPLFAITLAELAKDREHFR